MAKTKLAIDQTAVSLLNQLCSMCAPNERLLAFSINWQAFNLQLRVQERERDRVGVREC